MIRFSMAREKSCPPRRLSPAAAITCASVEIKLSENGWFGHVLLSVDGQGTPPTHTHTFLVQASQCRLTHLEDAIVQVEEGYVEGATPHIVYHHRVRAAIAPSL